MDSSGPIYLNFFSARQCLSCYWQWMLLQFLVMGILWKSVSSARTCCSVKNSCLVIPVDFKVLLDTAPLPLPTYSRCQFVEKMLFLLFETFPEYFYRYHCGAKKGNTAVAKQHLLIHLQNTHLNNIHLQ